jgi:hypothetical protein
MVRMQRSTRQLISGTSWARCRRCWCGTVRPRLAAGGPRLSELTAASQGFRGVLGTKCGSANLATRRPRAALSGYTLPGTLLPAGSHVGSPADCNTQLQAWVQVANRRRKRFLGCALVDRIAVDRAAMLALPPVPPATGGERRHCGCRGITMSGWTAAPNDLRPRPRQGRANAAASAVRSGAAGIPWPRAAARFMLARAQRSATPCAVCSRALPSCCFPREPLEPAACALTNGRCLAVRTVCWL